MHQSQLFGLSATGFRSRNTNEKHWCYQRVPLWVLRSVIPSPPSHTHQWVEGTAYPRSYSAVVLHNPPHPKHGAIQRGSFRHTHPLLSTEHNSSRGPDPHPPDPHPPDPHPPDPHPPDPHPPDPHPSLSSCMSLVWRAPACPSPRLSGLNPPNCLGPCAPGLFWALLALRPPPRCCACSPRVP